jgi:hypothetical protein
MLCVMLAKTDYIERSFSIDGPYVGNSTLTNLMY